MCFIVCEADGPHVTTNQVVPQTCSDHSTYSQDQLLWYGEEVAADYIIIAGPLAPNRVCWCASSLLSLQSSHGALAASRHLCL